MQWKILGAAALMAGLAACGTDPRERTTGGAAAGAATGAGIGALGGPVGALAGAAIGAGAGAVTGAATSPSDVNLGRPVWNDPEVRTPLDNRRGSARRGAVASSSGGSVVGNASVRQAQRELSQRGYDAGPADGVWGARSASAMRDFQRANNLTASGRLDSATAQALNVDASTTRTANTRAGTTTRTGSDLRRDGVVTGGGTAQNAPRTASPGASGMGTGSSGVGTGTATTGTTGSTTTGSGALNSTGSSGSGPNAPMGTGPGATGGVGSGNQPGTGGTPNTR